MSAMNYISSIERYHEYSSATRELLASMITGIADHQLLHHADAQTASVQALAKHYPFIDLLYTLNPQGIQTSNNIMPQGKPFAVENSAGKDRSRRPYYVLAKSSDTVVVTEPYFSSASRRLCVSAVMPLKDERHTVEGYVVLDIDLGETIEFLMGDVRRRRFQPVFKAIYVLIVLGLFAVVVTLLYSAFRELLLLSTGPHTDEVKLKPFGVIIFLTLALAVFDLGKTTLEEEVLMHKDIFRHSSTRRTITRFIAAILIAVSIEGLLLMFKTALGDGEHLLHAVAMMLASVGLLIGLGLYVYLGAKAEAVLAQLRK